MFFQTLVLLFSDVDECKSETAKCTQTCINNIGSFECSCNEGYELDEDGFTCRGDEV